MRNISLGCLAALVSWQVAALADTSDPGAARAQLQQGYTLKQQGKCQEAIPHFVESVRLDRHPKGLLNLADCEAKTGKLIAAQSHAVEARDLATARGLSDFEALAIKQLASLDKQTPKLVLQLAKDAPPDTVVLRDDTELGRVSLGTPLPLDPGAHVIVARGGGLERKYDVTLAEREVKTIDVTPVGGAKTATPVGVVAAGATAPAATPLAPAKVDPPAPTDTPPTAAPTPAAATTSSLAKDESPDVTNTSSRGSTQRTVAIVAGSVGVAGLAAGVVMGLVAKNSQNEAAARCPGGSCTDPSDVEQASSAQNLGNIATGVFIAGAASLVAGGVLWFTAPSPGKVGLFVTPTVGVSSGGIALFGRY